MAEVIPEALALAGQQEWSLESFLLYLLEQEMSGRQQRRIERLLREAHLPPGKTLAHFDQTRLPLRLRRQLPGLIQREFINQADNILILANPARGKLIWRQGLPTNGSTAITVSGLRPPSSWSIASYGPNATTTWSGNSNA
jgi:hypothetical protein